MIKINNWSVVAVLVNKYSAPETACQCLLGDAINHPVLGNRRIQTSEIATTKDRIVYTESGSVYKLGWIDPEYRKWIKKNYPNWNWRNPIIMKGV